MKIYLLLALGTIMLSCSSKYGSITNKDEKMTIINDPENIKWITGEKAKSWFPNQVDLDHIDAIYQNAIDKGEFDFLENPSVAVIKQRYRQYVCYLNERGEKIVHINSFCKIPEIADHRKLRPLKWKTEMVSTADGGSCYWNMKINLTSNKYYEMIINGES